MFAACHLHAIMSSDKFCCVPGCMHAQGTHQSLHGFPNPEKENDRFYTWVYAIGGNIMGLENEHIFKYRRVCRSHFEDKYLCRNNRISKSAVPTLNMPAFNTSTERMALQQIQNLTKPPTSSDPTILMPEPGTSQSLDIGMTKNTSLDPTILMPEPGTSQSLDIGMTKNTSLDPTILMPEPGTSQSLDIGMTKNTSLDPTILMPEPGTSQSLDIGTTKNTSLGRNRRRKLISKKMFLTKPERELYQQIVTQRIKLSRMKNKIRKQAAHLKAAKQLSNNFELLENCTSTAKLLMQIQWRENLKKDKGRRFTLQEKIAALAILKQSPKGYRFLRKFFILPSQQTLIKLIQMSQIKAGINKNVFNQLKTKAETMKIKEKLCIILFDEISLKANINYQERKDKICGLIDNGCERKAEFADHAQVFMMRGLLYNYKQAISYSFTQSATKGPELAKQLKTVISELQEAGFIVVATVCDQGTNNRQALKLLLNETRGIYLRKGEHPKENVILINDQEVVPLYDPPHLLKGIRNNLLTKNLEFRTKEGVVKTAKWSHLQQLYKENPGYKGIRLIPKLTENHINPQKFNKMKVKFASQIFSRTVASNLGYLADKGVLAAECKDTADLLLFMDNIFDSVNGSQEKNKFAKPLLGPVTPHSVHFKTWVEGIYIFETMYFLNPDGKKEKVPTVNNWVWTLKSLQVLLKKLSTDFDVTSVWMRHLNQDPIENFFGAVRSHGCRNTNPTCEQFESTFATLMINNVTSVHTRGNCSKDLCETLHNLIINENTETTPPCSFDYDFTNIFNLYLTPIKEKESNPRIIAPLQYISGYFLKKTKTHIFKTCKPCIKDLTSRDEIEYIKYREYAGRRWLCTLSIGLIELISNMQDVIHHVLTQSVEICNLKEIIKTAILFIVEFKCINCNTHRDKVIDYLINIVSRTLIYNYCKNINKILAGRREVDDDDDRLQIKAKKLNRCYKRKIN